jgi:hypothetical protein
LFEIGNSLREARERDEISFEQLEADTNIRARYLRALEEERFDLLPAESYARGFLEIYARKLGLDSQPYMDEFDSRFASGDSSSQAVRRIQSPRRLRLEASAVVLGLVGILASTVLVLAAWQFSGGEGTGGESGESAPSETTPLEEAEPALPDPVPVAPPPVVTVDEVPVEEVALVELKVTALKQGSRVTIRRNGPRGRVIFSDKLSRDETRVFTGERLHAAFRSPAALTVEVGGTIVSPLPRRLVVTADGWRRG